MDAPVSYIQKMLSRRRIPPVALAFVACVLPCAVRADSVALTNGQRYEGRVVSRDADDVVFEVRVSDSITETRTFKQAEIARLEVTPDWQVAFDALADTAPGPVSRWPQEYAGMIEQRLEPYLKAYPQSPRRKDIEARIAALKEESARVQAGELKLDDAWISAADAAPRRSEFEAEILQRSMADAVRTRDWNAALEILTRIESGYPGTQAVPAAVELARQMLPAFRMEVVRALESARRQKLEWDQGVAITPEHRRQALIDARNREEAAHMARIAEAEKIGAWPPLIPGFIGGAESLIARIDKEAERLAQVPIAAMRQSLKLSDEAAQWLARNEVARAEALLAQAQTAWKENESVARLRAAAERLRSSLEPVATPTPSPTPTPPPATPPPTPVPVVVEPPKPFYQRPLAIGLLAALVAAAVGSVFVGRQRPRGPQPH